MQGGAVQDWPVKAPAGPARRVEEKAALRDAARSCPPETAKALVVYALELEEKSGRVGGCPDPEEKAAWQAVQRWLRAWRGGALGQADPAAPTGSGRVAAQEPWGGGGD